MWFVKKERSKELGKGKRWSAVTKGNIKAAGANLARGQQHR